MPESTPTTTAVSHGPAMALFHVIRALLAGALFAGFLYVREPVFKVPEEHHIKSLGESQERWTKFLSEQARVDRLNAPLDFAVLGALLTAAFAMGPYTCCRPVIRILSSFPAGALVGAIVGAIGVLAHQRIIPYEVQATVGLTSQVQGILFGSLGVGVGFLVGLFNRSLRTALGGALAGLLGGGLAGIAYAALSLYMPAANIEPLIPPQFPVQLMWLGLGTGLLGLTIPIGACPAVKQVPATIPSDAPPATSSAG